ITPEISFPYGEDILELDDTGAPIKRVALRETGSQLFLAAATSGNQLVAKAFDKSENFITGEVTLSDQPVTMPAVNDTITSLQIGPDTRWLYVANAQGKLDMFDLKDRANPVLNSRVNVAGDGARVSDMHFLLGGVSLLIADSK